MKKRQKTVINMVFEKIIAVGSVLVWMKKCDVKYIGVVIAADYFAKAPEEVLVKMTKGKLGKRAEKSIFRRLHD